MAIQRGEIYLAFRVYGERIFTTETQKPER
jgi:hypothetical protein